MSIKSALRLFCLLAAFAAMPVMLAACDTMDDQDSDNAPTAETPQQPQEVPPEIIPVINDPQAEIWRPGYWAMRSGQFVWIPGKVINRPSPTAVWATSRWNHHTYGWSFEEGHWE